MLAVGVFASRPEHVGPLQVQQRMPFLPWRGGEENKGIEVFEKVTDALE